MIKIEKETAERMLKYKNVDSLEVIRDDPYMVLFFGLEGGQILEFRVLGIDCSDMEYEFLRGEWGKT